MVLVSEGHPGTGGDAADFHEVIEAARRGDTTQLGMLLDLYRGYLMTVAAEKLSPQFSAKVSPSDLVQETLLNAAKGFTEFRGTSENELRKWLTQILRAKAVDAHRYYGAYEIRSLFREVPLNEDSFDQSKAVADQRVVPSPSSYAREAENVRLVHAALDKLDDLNEEYRLVIQLRNFEVVGFSEIGARLGCSADAARKLWGRAIKALSAELRCLAADFQSQD